MHTHVFATIFIATFHFAQKKIEETIRDFPFQKKRGNGIKKILIEVTTGLGVGDPPPQENLGNKIRYGGITTPLRLKIGGAQRS